MDKRKKTAVTIVMTCILILIMALVIMYRIKENNSKDYTKYENQNTKETSTIQSSKIGLQRKDIEKIWNDSALEGNRQGKEFYRFEFPMYRGESVEEVFSLYFRFYVSCEDGEYYLDPRIIFGGFYNVIIFTANFKGIPDSLFESARIDGSSEYRVFFKIVLPLSKPVLSALGIFTAVGVWNDYTATLYYTRSPKLQTLSYYLLSVTKSSKAAEELSLIHICRCRRS